MRCMGVAGPSQMSEWIVVRIRLKIAGVHVLQQAEGSLPFSANL